MSEPIKSLPNQVISNEIRIFTAAKEVAAIDYYAENENIEKNPDDVIEQKKNKISI